MNPTSGAVGRMKLTFETDFSAFTAVLESEFALFEAKNCKPDAQKESLKLALLKTKVDETILKHSTRISDGRATYATLLEEIKMIWAKGEKRNVTAEDLPTVVTRDDWEMFKDKGKRLSVVGYTDDTLLQLLRAKIADPGMKNLVISKGCSRFSEVIQFLDDIEWPNNIAPVRQRDYGKTKSVQNRYNNVKCYNCGRFGHIQRFCRSKNDQSPSPGQ